MTPPPGFSTSPQIPNNTTIERPPLITIVFSVTTLENTPFAYRASTSANPNPMISPAFVEANYEDYDEEQEMEQRHEPNREATPTLRPRSPMVRRQRERVVGFEEAPNREGSRGGRNAEGTSLSEIEEREDENRGVNLPPLLAAHLGRNESGQPLRSSLTSAHGGHHHSTNTRGNLPPNGSFADSTGSVTPFFCWIEDYPHPDGLKMPSHIGSYDGKGDPDNFLHLFEGAIYMQKWLMLVACHMFTYTLKDSTRICKRSSQRLTYRFTISSKEKAKVLGPSLPDFGSTRRVAYLLFCSWFKDKKLSRASLHRPPIHLQGFDEKTYTWIEAREVATNGTPNDQRENFERSRKSSWDNNRGQKGRDRFSPYRGPNHGLLSNLSKSPKEILATEKAARSYEQPPHSRSCEIRTTFPSCERNQKERDESYTQNKVEGPTSEGKEITFPSGGSNSSAHVLIKAKIFGREVNQVHMDGGNSCKVIYEYCFVKLKPSIRASKVDSKVPLIEFSGENPGLLGKFLWRS
ncbi:hypothetical protein Tco_0905706 [Tanacetum coccineum]